MGLLDMVRGWIAPAPSASSSVGRTSAGYMRNDASPVFASWYPVLRESRDDVRMAYTRAAARSIESIQNSGWLAGAVRQSVASTIGTGLRLAAKPDPRCFNGDQAGAAKWARETERDFECWAGEPLEVDAAGKSTLAQMQAQALRSDFAYGETVGLVQWIERSCSYSRTKLKLLPAHYLVQDSEDISGLYRGAGLYQGVRVDRDGLPIAYRFQLNPSSGEKVEIAARDGTGRPRVIHIFDSDTGQMRGISMLTPILKVHRQFDQLCDATLTAALIQAIFAATVKSPAPTEQILLALQNETEQAATQGIGGGSIDDYFAAKTEWYEQAKLDLYGNGIMGKVSHLFPGEELDFKRSEHPNSTFEAHTKLLKREIAVALGMSYETFSGDYAGATYSSVRMRGSELWPIVLWRRYHIAAPVAQTAYGAWLEEEIYSGRRDFPGGMDAFIGQRPMATRADWRGPPKPQADDLKYAKAVEVLFNLGMLSAEQVCAELGADYEDTFEQIAKERQLRDQLGIPQPTVAIRDVNSGDQEKEAA